VGKSATMTDLGYDIAACLPVLPVSASIHNLTEDCVYHPWIGTPQTIPRAAARKLVRKTIAHEVRDWLYEVTGFEEALVITRTPSASEGNTMTYSLTKRALDKVRPLIEEMAKNGSD